MPNSLALPSPLLTGADPASPGLVPASSPRLNAPPPGGATHLVPALRLGAPEAGVGDETVARETPVELRINGRSHTILMATPTLLEELALGHCLSEGVVDEAAQVLAMETGQVELPATGPAHWVDLCLSPELARRARGRRLAPAATSCCLCGLASFKDLPQGLRPLAGSGVRMELDHLFALLKAMEAGQGVFARTGGTHAAALGTAEGGLISVAEDIGRHNALDKALGLALRRPGAPWEPGRSMAVLSGRLSYEMAVKIARVGIPLVASVSAPTELAVRLLEALNVTLVAFCRPPRATVYTHPHRVSVGGPI